MPNVQDRTRAVQALVDYWINEIGEIIQDPDSAELRKAVLGLETMSKTPQWATAIDKWIKCIDTMNDVIRIDLQVRGVIPPYKDLSFNSRNEYCRIFRWALLQGAVYASGR